MVEAIGGIAIIKHLPGFQPSLHHMPLTHILLVGWLIVGGIYWIWMAHGLIRTAMHLPRLARAPPESPENCPRLSIIIPACNEAATLANALRSVLAQDYPELEIVLIDDRSDDGTGALIDQLAAEDDRIRPIHIDHLPPGWLGKVHALHRGRQESNGEWLLFADADVHFKPDALRRAVAVAHAGRLDHLAVAPDIWPRGWIFDALVSHFLRVFCVAMRVWSVDNPNSSACVGVGAFNLVRREALDRTPGFEWLRMEVADDVGLGLMLKRTGARSALANGVDILGLQWYASLTETAIGVEKGYASCLGCSLTATVLATLSAVVFEMAPLAALATVLVTTSPVAITLAGIILAAFLVCGILTARTMQRGLVPALTTPLVIPLALALLWRATWLGKRRGGVLWRGTLYPSADLIASRRFTPANLLRRTRLDC